jgi:hypothetical protein
VKTTTPEPPAPPPARKAAQYSPEELAQFRAKFARMARVYRRAYWTLILLVAPLAFVDLDRSPWFFWALLAALVLMVVGQKFAKSWLRCPACEKKLIDKPGPYCPGCGAQAMQPGDWLSAPRCKACEKTFSLGRWNSCQLRLCTHCGVKLDEEGV